MWFYFSYDPELNREMPDLSESFIFSRPAEAFT